MTTKSQIEESSETAPKPVKRRLRNVTVTMEEDVAKWARMEAARRDMSVSRLLGNLVRERMGRSENYQRAMERALAAVRACARFNPFRTRSKSSLRWNGLTM